MVKKAIRIGDWRFFGLLIFASALAHFLCMFFFPMVRLPGNIFQDAHPKVVSPSIVTFELVGAEERELSQAKEELKAVQEAPEEETEAQEQEKKRQQFVDTASSAADEEVEAQTDKVGEKGTLAADTAPDDEKADGEPRLKGDSKALSIGGPPGEGPGQGPPAEQAPPEAVVMVAEENPEDAEEVASEQADTESKEGEQGEPSPVVEAEVQPTSGEPKTEEPTPERSEAAMVMVQKEEVQEDVAREPGARGQPPTPNPQPLALEAEQEGPSVVQKEEQPKIETVLEKKLALLKAELEELSPVQERPKELAYIPPAEPRVRPQEAKKPGSARPSQAGRSAKKRPKVAMSFNAKTLSGGDIMPLMEDEDSNAPRYGQEAFTVKKDEYAPYYRHIRDRISWYWVVRYGTRQEIEYSTQDNKAIIIEFKVYSEGVVKEVKILEEAGNRLLASYIKDTVAYTHFNKFPPNIKEEYIDVRFHFYFF